jgi:hypothetical protein
MKIDDLARKIEEFKSAQDKIDQNRQLWVDTTKPLLIKSLEMIRDKFDLGWDVQIIDEIKNFETVNISLGFKRSGLRISGNKMKSYLKSGGSLVFSQAYNGDIFVIVMYPFIEELVTEKENKLLGKYDPNTINEEFITDKVVTFIDEMIKWEKATLYNKIGFKI